MCRMQAIFVADIVLLLVLAALMAVLCGYGAYALHRAVGGRGGSAGWEMPPLFRPKVKVSHHQPYGNQLFDDHRYPRVYRNPLSEVTDPGPHPALRGPDPVTSPSPSPSPAYEPMVAPTLLAHSHCTTLPKDNRLCETRDWRYTEYQI